MWGRWGSAFRDRGRLSQEGRSVATMWSDSALVRSRWWRGGFRCVQGREGRAGLGQRRAQAAALLPFTLRGRTAALRVFGSGTAIGSRYLSASVAQSRAEKKEQTETEDAAGGDVAAVLVEEKDEPGRFQGHGTRPSDLEDSGATTSERTKKKRRRRRKAKVDEDIGMNKEDDFKLFEPGAPTNFSVFATGQEPRMDSGESPRQNEQSPSGTPLGQWEETDADDPWHDEDALNLPNMRSERAESEVIRHGMESPPDYNEEMDALRLDLNIRSERRASSHDADSNYDGVGAEEGNGFIRATAVEQPRGDAAEERVYNWDLQDKPDGASRVWDVNRRHLEYEQFEKSLERTADGVLREIKYCEQQSDLVRLEALELFLRDRAPRKVFKDPVMMAGLMGAYSACNSFLAVSRLWEETKMHRPYRVYKAWLLANIKFGQLQGCQRALREMLRRSYSLDLYTYEKLVQLFVTNGLHQLALKAMHHMFSFCADTQDRRNAHEVSNVVGILLDDLIEHERYDFASYVCVDLFSKGWHLRKSNFNLLLQCMPDDPDRMELAFSYLEKVGDEPRAASWALLMRAYANKADHSNVLRTRYRAADTSPISEKRVEQETMRYYAVTKNRGIVRDMFKGLKVVRDVEDLNILLLAGFSPKRILPEFHRCGIHPTARTFGIIAADVYHRIGPNFEAFNRLNEVMKGLGLNPRSREYTLPLFNQVAKEFEMNSAKDLLSLMEQQARASESHPLHFRTRLIQALVRIRRIEPAVALSKEIEKEDPMALEAIFFGYLREGDLKKAALTAGRMENQSNLFNVALSRAKELQYVGVDGKRQTLLNLDMLEDAEAWSSEFGSSILEKPKELGSAPTEDLTQLELSS